MGAFYGTVKYGATTYGPGVPVTDDAVDLWRRLYGGWSPALEITTPWRKRIPRVYGGDFLAVEVPIGPGTTLRLDSNDADHPEIALDLEVLDPDGDYLPGGSRANHLTVGSRVSLAWTVQTASAGPVTRTLGTFMVTQGLSTSRDRAGREVLRTSATGELLVTIRGTAFLASLPDAFWASLTSDERLQAQSSPLRAAIHLATYARVLDPTIPYVEDDPASWASVVLALAYWISEADDVTVQTGTPSGGPVPDPAEGWLDPLGVQSTALTWDGLFAYFADFIGVRVLSGVAGILGIGHTALVNLTGFTISLDPDYGGALPVPWERVTRQQAPTAYTSVGLWYGRLDEETPPSTTYERVAAASSAHPAYPTEGPLAHTENIVTEIGTGTTVGGEWAQSESAFVQDRLNGYIRRADTLTVEVDSACPTPAFNEAVRVHLPDMGISAIYQFMGADLPCSPAKGTWRLGWAMNL